jgi:hypothetical protein
VDGFRADQVVVVQDHRDLSFDAGQLVDEGAHHRLDGRKLRRTQRGQDPLTDVPLDGPKRAGSLSDSSRETQTTDRPPGARASNHSASKVVLPKPAGAETRVRVRSSRARISRKRGRATKYGRVLGARSLVVSSAWFTADAPTRVPRNLSLLWGGCWARPRPFPVIHPPAPPSGRCRRARSGGCSWLPPRSPPSSRRSPCTCTGTPLGSTPANQPHPASIGDPRRRHQSPTRKKVTMNKPENTGIAPSAARAQALM